MRIRIQHYFIKTHGARDSNGAGLRSGYYWFESLLISWFLWKMVYVPLKQFIAG